MVLGVAAAPDPATPPAACVSAPDFDFPPVDLGAMSVKMKSTRTRRW